jgi:CubicO group peptidase (beta-lactamase class C family)
MTLRRRLLAVSLGLSFATAVLAIAPSVLAQGLPRGRPDQLGFSVQRLARIDSVMQQYVDSGRVAGVVTLVARHGRIAQLGAYGWADREAGRRMTPDVIFRIASQSKAVTSVAVMALVEEGLLRLSDPVSRWLPSFAAATVATSDSGHPRVPARRAITIRDLLTHTAGISYGTDSLVRDAYRAAGLGPAAGYGWYYADKAEPICASMDRLGSLPFVAQPGERFVYGYNTDILGCVVERVSGQPFDAFLRTRIFGPLGMRDTRFFLSPELRGRLAAVYAANDRGGYTRAAEGPLGQGAYVDGPRESFSGGAGLLATAADYARFLQMLLDGGTLDGSRILAPATVALMTQNHLGPLYATNGATGFGLGFEVLLDPGRAAQYGSVGRYGWGGAYATNYWVDPGQDLVAVFMIQLIPSGGLDLADKFRTLVYQAIVAPGVRVGTVRR